MHSSTLLAVVLSFLGVSASPLPYGSSYGGNSVATVDGTQKNPAVVAQMLNSTNYYRYLHGGAPVTWNQSVADWAQSNMGKCIFRHSKSPYGENLAGESGSTDPNRDVMHEIKMWYDEGDKCDYNTPSYSHFTALIWNSVTSIGCARVYCDPVMNEDGSKGFSGWFLQCDYYPTANLASTESFKANVLPPKNSGAGYSNVIPSGSGSGSVPSAVPTSAKAASAKAKPTSYVAVPPSSTPGSPVSAIHPAKHSKSPSAQPTSDTSMAPTTADAEVPSSVPTGYPSESSPVPNASCTPTHTRGGHRGYPTGNSAPIESGWNWWGHGFWNGGVDPK